MGVFRHGYDITRILIGHALSDVRFDWLVGKYECVSTKSISIKEKNSIFLPLSNYSGEIFHKSNRGLSSTEDITLCYK